MWWGFGVGFWVAVWGVVLWCELGGGWVWVGSVLFGVRGTRDGEGTRGFLLLGGGSCGGGGGTFEFGEGEGDAVDDGFGTGRAAGDVDVDGENAVEGAFEGVGFVEDAAGNGAGPDGDDDFGVGHLVVDAAEAVGHLFRDGAGDEEGVGVPGGPDDFDAEALDVVAGGDHGDVFDVAAVAGAGVAEEDPEGIADGAVGAGGGFFGGGGHGGETGGELLGGAGVADPSDAVGFVDVAGGGPDVAGLLGGGEVVVGVVPGVEEVGEGVGGFDEGVGEGGEVLGLVGVGGIAGNLAVLGAVGVDEGLELVEAWIDFMKESPGTWLEWCLGNRQAKPHGIGLPFPSNPLPETLGDAPHRLRLSSWTSTEKTLPSPSFFSWQFPG